MSRYPTDTLRTVALVGQAGSGKTSLAEALLLAAGAIPAAGSVDKGTTVADSDPQERAWGHSLASAVLHLDCGETRIHLIDTPGLQDFSGQTDAALMAVETALIVVDAVTGVTATTERMMQRAAERGLCRMIVINRIDAAQADLPALLADLRTRFGKACLVLDLPARGAATVLPVLETGDGESDIDSPASAHRALIEQIVEEDDTLLARYLEDGADPSAEDLHAPFEKALREGHLIPVLFTSATTGAGVAELLQVLSRLAPSPLEGNPPLFIRHRPGMPAEAFRSTPDASAHVLAHVFKVVADPYLGRLAVFRVHQGTVRKDMSLYVGSSRRPVRLGHVHLLQGKSLNEVEALLPGDIGAVAKLDDIGFDAVLHDSHDEDDIALKPPAFAEPMAGLAVLATKRADEQRLFDVLEKLAMEDPTFRIERDPASQETVIRGLGELHLKAKLERMAGQYKLDVETRPPRIPYRETITAAAEALYRHKKQSGGAGQFGEVHLRVEPKARGEGVEFVDAVKGGAIPGVFMAAVEKGVQQALAAGVLAGFTVHDLKVTVFDGKTHPVDGKDIAFTIAARKALIEAVRQARPIVLEPVMALEIQVPESAIGDVSSDLSGRRGHLTGTEVRGRGLAVVTGEVPLAELNAYGARLKSLTAGEGRYSMALSRYAPVPPAVQAQLAQKFRLHDDDE